MSISSNNILIIGFVWPEPNSTAAGNRMLQLIHFFLGHNYHITFACTAVETVLSANLEALGIEKVLIQLNHSSFDRFVKGLNPKIVLFDRFLTEEQFGWRVARSAPNALRILDTEDLHSLRYVREASFKANSSFTTDKWLESDVTKREMASIYRCDISLVISSYEMELLTKEVKIAPELLLHLPFLLDKIHENTSRAWVAYKDRKDFVCIGNGKHAPNIDAVVWLKKEIWPLIHKALPDTKLHIYGAYLTEHIQQMHAPKEGFYISGWSSNIGKVLEAARINLAPLRFGAGIKGKLIDAMQHGIPSITTSIGSEGMHEGYEWSGRIAENTKEYAQAAVQLYKNGTEWKHVQQNGINIVNGLYNQVTLSKKFLSKIKIVGDRLEQHRTQNFIGAMLMHHSLASTKYMTKWIEAKNK